MRMPVIALSAALFASSATAVWLWTELHAERARTLELTQRLEATGHRDHPPESINVAATAAPSPSSPATSSAPVVESRGPLRASGTQEDWDQYQRRLLQDPKYREAVREQARLNYALRRANLMRVVGLSGRQADALVDLQIDQDLRWQSRPAGSINEGMIADEVRTLEAEARAVIGDEKFARYQDYMASRPSRMQVDRFRGQLTGAVSLRDDQVEPLIAALHVDQAQLARDVDEYRQTLDWTANTDESWRRLNQHRADLTKSAHASMHSSASAILSPSQLEQLDAMLKRELEAQAAQARIQKVRSRIDAGMPASKSE